MTYSIGVSGKPNTVVLHDFLTGTERILREEAGLPGDIPSSIAPDGSKVIFRRSCNPISFGDCPSLLLDTSSAQLQKICDFCTARGFSSDGSTVLVQNYAHPGEGKDKIVAIDLHSQRQREFLADAQRSLYHAYLSWDDHWVVFKRLLSVGKSEM